MASFAAGRHVKTTFNGTKESNVRRQGATQSKIATWRRTRSCCQYFLGRRGVAMRRKARSRERNCAHHAPGRSGDQGHCAVAEGISSREDDQGDALHHTLKTAAAASSRSTVADLMAALRMNIRRSK